MLLSLFFHAKNATVKGILLTVAFFQKGKVILCDI